MVDDDRASPGSTDRRRARCARDSGRRPACPSRPGSRFRCAGLAAAPLRIVRRPKLLVAVPGTGTTNGWLQNRSRVGLAKIASAAFRSASMRGSSSAGGSTNFGATVMRRAGNVRASDRHRVRAARASGRPPLEREPPACIARPPPRRRPAPGPATSLAPPGRTPPSDPAIAPARHRGPAGPWPGHRRGRLRPAPTARARWEICSGGRRSPGAAVCGSERPRPPAASISDAGREGNDPDGHLTCSVHTPLCVLARRPLV